MIARAILSQGITEFISRVIAFIVFPILARYAGPDGLGAYSQVNTFTGFIVPFASLGLSGAIIRFCSTDPWSHSLKRELLKIVIASCIVSLLPTLLMIGFSEYLNDTFLRYSVGSAMFKWGALLIFIGTLEQVLLNFCRARLWFYRISIYNFIQNISLVVGAFSLLPREYSILHLLQFSIALKFVSLLGLWFWIWYQSHETSGDVKIPKLKLRTMMRFGLAVSITSLGLWLINFGDRLVIGHFLSASELGIYGSVYALAFIMAGVNGPLNQPMYPQIVKAVQEGSQLHLQNVVKKYHRLQALLLTPIAIPLIVIAKPILILIGGPEFLVAQNVVTFTVAAIFLDQFNASTHYILLANDQQKFTQNSWIVAGIVNLLGNLILTPRWGLEGAALVTFASLGGLQFVLAFKTRKFVPIERLYQWKIFVQSCIASGLSVYITGLLITLSNALQCALYASSYLCIYIVFLVALRALDRNDLSEFKKILGLPS